MPLKLLFMFTAMCDGNIGFYIQYMPSEKVVLLNLSPTFFGKT